MVGNYFRERMTEKQNQTQKQNKNEEWAQVIVYIYLLESNKNNREVLIYWSHFAGNF